MARVQQTSWFTAVVLLCAYGLHTVSWILFLSSVWIFEERKKGKKEITPAYQRQAAVKLPWRVPLLYNTLINTQGRAPYLETFHRTDLLSEYGLYVNLASLFTHHMPLGVCYPCVSLASLPILNTQRGGRCRKGVQALGGIPDLKLTKDITSQRRDICS